MPSNLRIVSIRDFIKLTPKGNLDLAKMKEGIVEAAARPGAFTDYDLLIDTRGLESLLSVFELWELAQELAKLVHAASPKGFRAKIPLLCPVERLDLAQFTSLSAQNVGLNVRAFTSFEDVFDWLSRTSTPNQEESS